MDGIAIYKAEGLSIPNFQKRLKQNGQELWGPSGQEMRTKMKLAIRYRKDAEK
jgi:hypothetical protein